MPKADKKPSRLYRVAVWTLAVVALLLFLNFGARVALYNLALYRSYQVTKNFYGIEGGFWQFKRTYEQAQSRSILRAEPYVQDIYNRFFFLPAVTGHQYGFRAPAPAPEPAPGVTRILCLGPSTTEGAYPRPLQEKLSRVRQGKYEVIDAGISGVFDLNLLMNYALIWRELKPALVLVECNVNEPMINRVPFEVSDKFVGLDPSVFALPRGMQNSKVPAFYRLGRYFAKYTANRQARAEHPSPEGLLRYRKVLTALAEAIKGSGAEPVFLTYQSALTPDDTKGSFSPEFLRDAITFYRSIYLNFTVAGALEALEAQNRIMREVAAAQNLTLIETCNTLPREDRYFRDGNHHDRDGDLLIAEKVAEVILSRERPPAEN
ncbi:MAG: hypothetical protein ACTSXZ_07910 [Alphaproteobacteria bacterium]